MSKLYASDVKTVETFSEAVGNNHVGYGIKYIYIITIDLIAGPVLLLVKIFSSSLEKVNRNGQYG